MEQVWSMHVTRHACIRRLCEWRRSYSVSPAYQHMHPVLSSTRLARWVATLNVRLQDSPAAVHEHVAPVAVLYAGPPGTRAG